MNYFVDVIDGVLTHIGDDESAISSLSMAKQEAIETLSQLMRCKIDNFDEGNIVVCVRDNKGKKVFKLKVNAAVL